MSTFTFILAQTRFATADMDGNLEKIRIWADRAATDRSISMCAFPAQALNGVNNADLFKREDYIQKLTDGIHELGKTDHPFTLVAGCARMTPNGVENAASISRDKQQDFSSQQNFERAEWTIDRDYFSSGKAGVTTTADGMRVAVLWVDDLLDDALMQDIIAHKPHMALVLSAERWQQGAESHRRRLFARCAKAYHLPIAWLNQVGGHDEYVIDGASCLVNADGHMVTQAPRFEEACLKVSLDTCSGQFQALDWPASPALDRTGKLYQALVCALHDYVHDNGFDDVLLGLSGGIDSALTLALAVDALGAEHVTAIMLPSRYTSRLSIDGAEAQISKLGVAHKMLSIENSFASILATLKPAFAGKQVDTTEENLQARIRGVLLMALSNKHRQLLLVCSNKSETAVGYSTLYGDMCGAFVPLIDVYKTQVYHLSRWRNRQGDGEIIPQVVIDRPPSAELREGQADADSLPAYDELDGMLKAFIEDGASQDELVNQGYARAQVERVIKLVVGNEFKRQQAAMGPRVSRVSFARDRRYPVVQKTM